MLNVLKWAVKEAPGSLGLQTEQVKENLWDDHKSLI